MGAARMEQYTCEQRTRGTSEEGGGTKPTKAKVAAKSKPRPAAKNKGEG